MGKNKQKTSNKSKKDDKDDGATKNDLKTKNSTRLSLEALDDMSNSDEGSLPPENEWNDDAKRLRDSIMSGKFDHLLEREDGDASSVEEVELGDDEVDEDSEEESGDDVQEDVDASSDNDPEAKKKAGNRLVQNEASSSDDEEEEDSDNEAEKKSIPKDSKADNSDSQEENERVDSSEDEGNEEILDKTMDQKNQISSKALHVVTEELAAQKAGWSWAETFDVVPQTKLPFDKKANTEEHIDIHDDLKREVTFYDLALEAANEARLKCEEHGISFSRPDDFFAEMVKTDGMLCRALP
jgi:rRNA-processing protein EBP2